MRWKCGFALWIFSCACLPVALFFLFFEVVVSSVVCSWLSFLLCHSSIFLLKSLGRLSVESFAFAFLTSEPYRRQIRIWLGTKLYQTIKCLKCLFMQTTAYAEKEMSTHFKLKSQCPVSDTRTPKCNFKLQLSISMENLWTRWHTF